MGGINAMHITWDREDVPLSVTYEGNMVQQLAVLDSLVPKLIEIMIRLKYVAIGYKSAGVTIQYLFTHSNSPFYANLWPAPTQDTKVADSSVRHAMDMVDFGYFGWYSIHLH